MRWISWTTNLLAVGLLLSSTALAESFWHRGTDFYLSADLRSGVSPRVHRAQSFQLDAGFAHDISGTGVHLDLFARFSPRRVNITGTDFDRRLALAGVGYGLGYKFARFKLMGGGYVLSDNVKHLQGDKPVYMPLSERGGYARLSYYLVETDTTSLQVELSYERGLIDSDALDKRLIDEAVTLGLRASVGKFCGGKVLAYTAAVVAVAALIVSASKGCGGFCYTGGDLWPRTHRSSSLYSRGGGC